MKFFKNMKKLLYITLCAALIGGTAAFGEAVGFVAQNIGSLTVSAANDETPASSFEYEENDDGGITIKNFIGSETRVVIPSQINGKSVSYIGDGAFQNCTGLINIIIPDSVTYIGEWAFYGCNGLTSITIPGSVKDLGYKAFSSCIGLTSVIIGKGTTTIGHSFDGCTGLKNVIIPESVTEIHSFAFSDCIGLTNITIPDSVTSITYFAFSGCTGLGTITIPDSVKNLELGVFEGCTGLRKVTLGNGLKTFNGGVFKDCTALREITIPDSVTNIGDEVFIGCTALRSVVLSENITSIGKSAFLGCTRLEYISIPDSVVRILDSAFCNCTSLNNVDFGKNITLIGDGAFVNCSKLASITIPDSVTSIDHWAFSVCTGLKSVTIGNNVTSIGNYAFSECTGLTSITIPDSVTSIGYYTFNGCSSLTSITIPDSVTSIGVSAFYDCSSLTSITIPDSITSIENSTFKDCTSLISITIPDSVTRIEKDAFNGCVSLTIYGISGSYAETFAEDNNIPFVVIVEDSELTNISSISAERLDLDETLTITGAAEKGKAPYRYAYYYKNSTDTKWSVIGAEFSTAIAAAFKPTIAADYDIKVVVKDAKGDTAEKLFKVSFTQGLTNTSWLNAEKVQIGDDIRVTGGAEGGEGGYKYAFYFKRSANSKWNKIGEEFGTKTYGITVPKAAADYDMKVIVKDSAGNTAQKFFKVTVVESLPLTNISLINTPTEISVGRTVTIAGRQVGGAKPFTYEFYFKRSANSKWNKLSYGSDKHTYAKFTPTTAAEYDLKAVVIDSKGTKAEKIYKITAK